ncbi:unnamed protein product, partial [Tetraodon nigroviridis]
VVPALWLGLDLHLCWLLRLPPVLLHPPLPRALRAAPVPAGGHRSAVALLLQAAGPSGERHGELLPASAGRSRVGGGAASAGAAGRCEQERVCPGRDAVVGLPGVRGGLPAVSVLPVTG